ncbi:MULTISPECIES: Maf family protein [Corynebacterium]|uniref:Nucleoside triphosphate pyrophosphatase n=1 Tax=Corynebacterium striatum TaxID=43770 RepID=A0ABX7DG99_CORST|nr:MULTISPECIES: nucleoside triphosphate pyrophosphatase [Corynebacterium]EGT5787563.1 septum formation inhibitor Maf [Corynebacterium striatum]KAA1271395.1 septum formation inhibitor Maf [Corynebacterium striatum]MDK8787968.1 nucleoside triphosphate pyrophosphatase [Corynebacterium striatum]MDK8880921.1 nucleoside triphosphate pyrophosphatase [Corynebacterium striatum]OFT66316.1 septum formation inhibitor Maf [Corynebacterium sp. HMSC05D08]
MRIVLASQSPSRASILRGAGVEPVLAPAHVDEDAIETSLSGAAPADIVAALATAKAEKIAPEYPQDVVIGGDSMLLLDGVLQGKPHTVDATIERWRAQAGRRAELLTGHCIIQGDKRHVETSRTSVFFAAANERDIAAYAATGEPLECAGAFTLEAIGGWFIDRIEGDPSSVIGLSLPVVRRALYSFDLCVSDFWAQP